MKYIIKRLPGWIIRYIQLLLSWCILHVFRKNLLKQNIWIIREKRDEARDNGYHFFKYIKENHPEIHAFYVITPDSSDKYKVEKYGDVIDADSWRHCIYFLAAEYSINSQQYGAYPFRFDVRMLNIVQKLCNKKQKVIFLQHGITKDKFSVNEFLYGSCNIDYFVTSAKREYQFIKETYGYPPHAIGCIGMARFDYLHTPHIVENKILVMPTWRKWLDRGQTSKSTKDKQRFLEGDYFSAYAKILSDQEILQYLRKHNYKLVFYVHYKMQPYVDTFRSFENDVIVIADKANYDVQELLMSSKMMITDYSSVFFDFAYMNKPLLYYQFDKEQFRASHYSEGYFSYEDDGFGPCFDNFIDVRKYILDMIDSGCRQLEKYDLRVKTFFDLRDNHNCERTYNALKELEKMQK